LEKHDYREIESRMKKMLPLSSLIKDMPEPSRVSL